MGTTVNEEVNCCNFRSFSHLLVLIAEAKIDVVGLKVILVKTVVDTAAVIVFKAGE